VEHRLEVDDRGAVERLQVAHLDPGMVAAMVAFEDGFAALERSDVEDASWVLAPSSLKEMCGGAVVGAAAFPGVRATALANRGV
jgi:hypothetical protein